MAVTDRLKKAWNAFRHQERSTANNDPVPSYGAPVYIQADSMRRRTPFTGERTIISSIYTRLSIDVAEVEFKHVTVDDTGRYLEDKKSKLNDALLFETNLDQVPEQFRRDIAMTMFTEGTAAIVPVDTTVDPNTNEIFDIYTLRVGKVVQWYPEHVKVNLYNEKKGIREDVVLEKRAVALIENPFYSVMNESNSTLQRLIRKLNMLDAVDEQSSSGKLDLIIKLPYMVKSEARQAQAEKRRKDIEFQLKGSQYGIAYIDGTEDITQLNRPAENQLLAQIQYLTGMLYQQLGLTEEIMNGTADEKTMLNYQNRTVVPIVNEITKSVQRAFLGLDRYKKNERIMYFSNPFKFVPLSDIAEISDKFTRNEIATSNEIRAIIGFVPSDDPKADKLMNSNMPQGFEDGEAYEEGVEDAEGGSVKGGPAKATAGGGSNAALEAALAEMDAAMNEILDGIESEVDNIGVDDEDEDEEEEDE